MNCDFCGKEAKNPNSYRQHKVRCSKNPDRIKHPNGMLGKKGKNQFTKAELLGINKPTVTEETRKKMSKSSTGRSPSEATRKKLSIAAKNRNFGGVNQSRWIEYNGVTLGSSYELAVAKSMDESGVKWETCSKLNYVDNEGHSRSYTPDFYLREYDVYLDPKNDFLINNVNPALGFSDVEKIKMVEEQNDVRVLILNKDQLSWSVIEKLIENMPV